MTRYWHHLAIAALLVTALLAGCALLSRPQAVPAAATRGTEGTATASEDVIERPDLAAGTAGLTGTLFTYAGDVPVPGTVFYLTPGRGESGEELAGVFSGPDPEQGDITSQSDAEGRFVLTDVPPGKYYIVVWAPYNWIVGVSSEEDPTPRVIELKADTWTDLGKVALEWP